MIDDYYVDWRGQRPSNEAAARRMEDPQWGEITERISNADRDWFAAHAGRRCRLRPMREEEQPLLDERRLLNPHVIVYQLEPGVRVRCYVEIANLVRDDDGTLWRIFRSIIRRQQPELWQMIKEWRPVRERASR